MFIKNDDDEKNDDAMTNDLDLGGDDIDPPEDNSDEIEDGDDDREDIIKLLEMIKKIYVSKCSQDEQKKVFSDIEHMLILYREYNDEV